MLTSCTASDKPRPNLINRLSYSGIIGSKVFVDWFYQEFKNHFSSKHEKKPKVIQGLEGVYSLKRLSEAIYMTSLFNSPNLH